MTDVKSYPYVDQLIETFAQWLRHRRDVAETCLFDAAEYSRIAQDLGVTSSDLDALVQQGAHAAEELPRLLGVLGIDERAIARAQPLVMRDLQRVCALCQSKDQCNRDFAEGHLAQHYAAYCGNKDTLDALELDASVVGDKPAQSQHG